MDDWFQKIARKTIARSLSDAANSAKDQKPGVTLSNKPLIVVVAEDTQAHTKDILLTGDQKISDLSAFARVQCRVTTGPANGTNFPVNIVSWQAIVGDVRFNQGGESAVDLALRFQKEANDYSVSGHVMVTPFPRLAAYGAFGDGKFVVTVDAELPPGAPLALGPTGMAIWGIQGTFAHNFKPRLPTPDGVQPTAADYAAWARGNEGRQTTAQWLDCRPGESATGLGLGLSFGTVDGFVFMSQPAGLSFLTPGALIIGGQGKILKQEGFKGDFYVVFDFPSGSAAFTVAATIEVKVPWDFGVTTLSGNGQLDMFFSFTDPTAWYINAGREDAPVKLSVLKDVPIINILFSEQAEAYLQINHHRIALGAKLGIGGEFRLLKGKIKLIARLAAQLAATIARDPFLVKAVMGVSGELGISVWDFDFHLKGEAHAVVYFPNPTVVAFDLAITLDLPFPLPTISTSSISAARTPAPPPCPRR
ncbi:MAG: hypothetical protein WDN06_01815, partial [Asticcacaulis sp.]